MATDRVIFIPAGPSPHMRFKLVRCPVGASDAVAAMIYTMTGILRNRCDREIMVFFKHLALCPLHGVVPTEESWNEEGGTYDN